MAERGLVLEVKAWHVVLALVLLGLLAFLGWQILSTGRATPTPALVGGAEATRAPASTPGEPPVEDIGETVFDRAGPARGEGGGAPKQVTPEASRAGEFEVDLGTAPTRPDAERIARLVASTGARAAVIGDPAGYRIVAGPFATREEAQAAAAKLGTASGRTATVH